MLNAIDGVHIHAEGESKLVDEFVMELSENAPAAAQVTEIEMREVPIEPFDSFEIRFSEDDSAETTFVSPDLATCDQCTAELFDPKNRRYRYPFINCTNCGPRFTIIERLPYDRPNTSMSKFSMCSACELEYTTPENRRFHAQPNACFECGPHISWSEDAGKNVKWGLTPKESDEIFARAVKLLKEGKIVAIKGLGGFHLACDAGNPEAVALLRERKHRFGKAFAVMVNDVDAARAYCEVCDEEAAILGGATRPIVLLKKRAGSDTRQVACTDGAEGDNPPNPHEREETEKCDQDATDAVCGILHNNTVVDDACADIVDAFNEREKKALAIPAVAHVAKGVADGLPELGVMLPYTPVQLILMHDFANDSGVSAAISDLDKATETVDAIAGVAGEPSGEGSEGRDRTHAAEAYGAQAPPALVMTSGNMHDEPICIADEEAYERLADIADAFLGNDREILSRFDDSVIRVIDAGSSNKAIQMIRRARGYAPTPISFEVKDLQASASTQTEGVGTSTGSEAFGAETEASQKSASNASDSGAIDNKHAADPKGPGRFSAMTVFAAGPEQKNTFTFLRVAGGAANPQESSSENARSAADTQDATGDGASDGANPTIAEAFVSQHIGDMENADAFHAWLEAKDRMQGLFDLTPTKISCDMHPEYITTKWAHEQAALKHLPLDQVQHHHAHIASVIAENGLPSDQAVCGIAFDGTGYGADGNIWGGEVLLANMADYERFANFAYVPMPGGAAAIKHPLQMAYGVLWEFDLLEHPGAKSALAKLGDSQCELLDSMIEQGINTPVTSSVGRLFDAASALLGICTEPTYEGEPAILLEAAMQQCDASEVSSDSAYHIAVTKNTASPGSTAHDTSVVLFDAAPLFEAMLDDIVAQAPVAEISRKFHDAFVEAIMMAAQLVFATYEIKIVALSGGVFMNRCLIEHSISALEQAGFTVALNRELPPNDGCASFGEAVVSLFGRN